VDTAGPSMCGSCGRVRRGLSSQTTTTERAMGEYYTISGIPKNTDHISGFRLACRMSAGKSNIDLRFVQDPAKALRFDGKKDAELALTALRMFMCARMSNYGVIKHAGEAGGREGAV
jgi:hypothetical protein